MADNYLENKFEQYKARKVAWEKVHKLGNSKKRNIIKLPNESLTNCDTMDETS